MNYKAGIILRLMAMLAGVTAMVASCKKHLIYDYEGNCDDEVEILLKYDYNTQRADMRAFHTGYAVVYAVDENGRVAATQEVFAPEIKDVNYRVKFRGLQPGRYSFTAMAMQRPYADLAKEPDARFRAEFPANGEDISKLNVRLDRAASADAQGRKRVTAPKNGLDSLWIGRSVHPYSLEVPTVDQQFGKTHRDTVSLVRDTKYLHLNLHQLDEDLRADIHHDRYQIEIVDANGHLDYLNNLIADEELVYSPHAAWTTSMDAEGRVYYGNEPDGAKIVERAAHYELSFSRLMYYAAGTKGKNAVLRIFDKYEDNRTVVEINLPYYLAMARGWFETQHYSEQEFLDREYDYHMDFFLTKGEWSYVALRINIMPWVMRIQNEIM